MSLSVTTVPVDDPLDLLSCLPEPGGVAWVRNAQGLVGWGEAARFEPVDGENRFARAQEEFAAWVQGCDVRDELCEPGTGPVAMASFTFDARSSGSVLVVPRIVLGRRGSVAWLTVVGDEPAPPVPMLQALTDTGRIRYAGAALDEVSWLEAVARAVSDIGAGALDKVVLARDLLVWSESPLDTRVLARRLAERFPDCYTFICDGLVGATPELLVRRSGMTVESLVLAGSAARGETGADDDRIAQGLLTSAKDLWEHELAVASVRPRLLERCRELVTDGPQLLRLANVQHLATRMTGRLHTAEPSLSLVAALHPTAAVCGTPTAKALDRIRALEGMDRGRYAGPVGWMDARGDGEFGIALRCAEVDGTRARLFAGAGVVGDSLPESELEETRLKLRAVQSALEANP